ncbi:AraC family transcriptional regulator [Maribacter hydrothermalis]|uniref:Transcriptional regulator n=1 Tax=Maribacter hydrothermalis TaxID=1836467 RepID=A0A1B7Z1C5_9FLAO|nr:helix-turn-helix domain-containing protein [Maribacter hydrothermalis]APQ18168.1 AraC family transcriptional regulator [Maribacter hydrothermalis]OBR36515.1 transcriptional regulator [Maribacter hydrothermalis]
MNHRIRVHDIDVKIFIEDIAKSLKLVPEEDANEICVRIPEKIGFGFIKATCFDYGLGVLEFNFLLKQELILEYEKGSVHPLKLLFNRESTITHKFEDIDEMHEIDLLENVITSSTPQNNHIFIFPTNTSISLFSIEINRKLFEEKISEFLTEMDEDLMKLFRDVNGTQIFYSKGFYGLDIAKFIEEFMECELVDFMKTVYQEGKAYEILTFQLQHYLKGIDDEGINTVLNKATLEKIEKAAKIIENELDRMDNIVVLAKRVGLNQTNLQRGFKKLYKTSVNQYIKNFRIEKAKELLETTDLNITQISYKIGINSRSYFSKLFKEKYGLSPRDFYQHIRKSTS